MRSKTWLRYTLLGIAGALLILAIGASWVLALRSGERARLERDAPTVLGTTYSLNKGAQELIDDAATKPPGASVLKRPALNQRTSTHLTDYSRTLESLLAVVEQSNEGGLREAQDDLRTAIQQNIDYLEGVHSLLQTPILDVDKGMGSDIATLASEARSGFSAVFQIIHAETNPYADSTKLLEADSLLTSLLDAQETVNKMVRRYENRRSSVQSYMSDLQSIKKRYDTMRSNLKDGDIARDLQGSAWNSPSPLYDDALNDLDTAIRERSEASDDAWYLAESGPTQLRPLASELAGILSAGSAAVEQGRNGVEEWWCPEDSYDGCSHYYDGVAETPEWQQFIDLGVANGHRYDAWKVDFASAVTQIQRSLQKDHDELKKLGADVSTPVIESP